MNPCFLNSIKSTPLVVFSFLVLTDSIYTSGLPVADLKIEAEINFNKDIYPFLKRNCLACHNESKAKAKLILETADDIRKGSENGLVVVPGKATESLLFTTSAHLEEEFMPPKKNSSKAENLTPHELALLKAWINQGAKGSGNVIAEAPKHWLQVNDHSPVYALAISPDGRYAASGHGQQIDIYDIKLQTHLTSLKDPVLKSRAHQDLVRSLSFDNDGTLASGGYREIKLWQSSGLKPRPCSELTSELTKDLSTSFDGHWSITIKNETNELIKSAHTSKEHKTLSFKDKITSAIILNDQLRIAIGYASGNIQIIETLCFDTPAEVEKKSFFLKGQPSRITHLISTKSCLLLSSDDKGRIVNWDLDAKKEKYVYEHGAGLKLLSISADGKRILSAHEKNKVLLWDVNNPSVPLKHLQSEKNLVESLNSLNIDKDVVRSNIARENAAIVKFEEMSKTEFESTESISKLYALKELELKESMAELKTCQNSAQSLNQIKSIQASSNLVTNQIDKNIENLNSKIEKLKLAITELETKIISLSLNKSRALIVNNRVSQDLMQSKITKKVMEDLDLKLQEQITAINEKQSKEVPNLICVEVSFSPDHLFFSVAYQHGEVHLYKNEDGSFLETIYTFSALKKCSFVNSRDLIMENELGQKVIWPTQREWSYSHAIGDGKDGSILIDRVTALAFSKPSVLISASGRPSRKGQIKKWDTKALTLLSENLNAHHDMISGIQFSPDKKEFVTCSDDGIAHIFDSDSLLRKKSLEGHSLSLLDVAWSKDGRLIATASADKKIILWNADSGEIHKTISENEKEISVVKFLSKNSEDLILAHGEGELTAKNKKLSGAFDYIYTATVSPDDALILAGGKNGLVRIWDSKTNKLLKSWE